MKRIVALVSLLILLVGITSAATVTLTADADTWVRDGSSSNYGNDESMYLVAGAGRVGYMRFDLSSLGDDITVESATLKLYKVTAPWGRSDTLVTGRIAVVGLDDVDGNTEQNWDELALSSSNVGAEFLGSVSNPIDSTLVTNLDAETGANVTEAVSSYTEFTLTGDDLVSFLQGRADDTGLATLIASFPGTDFKGYWLGSSEYSDSAYVPVLEVTYIPEPATMALIGLGCLIASRKKHN